MPSPIGHSLAALAVGWGVAGVATGRSGALRQAAILAAVGVAPDLDLLIGRHSLETHSVGAAVLVASVAAWQRWPVATSRRVIWTAVALAWLSHPLADALSIDTSSPYGVMALWPVSSGEIYTGWDVFGPISRRYWLDNFWYINLTSLVREVAILLPIATLVWWGRRPRT
ncbi:MAG: metal-dependent hydrolase [Acidobacteria bacterium]|jgi:membrane-bound metal-dependent hydrolase YbcI (DUF457 family)|nr:metal-dependent hydrolase [Acidobacteriota bacterium]